MKLWLLAIFFAASAAPVDAGITRHAPTPAADAKAGQLVDITGDFAGLADETAAMPDAERVVRFHALFDPVVPGYYNRDGDGQARFDGEVMKAIRDFPMVRAKVQQAATDFGAAFARGQAHFRAYFADYTLTVPVYLVHSIGTQDGGTRTIAGRTIMFFGADVIAKIHDSATIGPFLDHELFHIYHEQAIPECAPLWCSLWAEGLAVYTAATLNPGADDRVLLLTSPVPLRAAVDPRLAEAACLALAKFSSTDEKDYAPFFYGQPSDGPFPPRFGYYLGYRVAQDIARTIPLTELAKFSAAQAEPLVRATLENFGHCSGKAPVTASASRTRARHRGVRSGIF